jgi:hypothetical protein
MSSKLDMTAMYAMHNALRRELEHVMTTIGVMAPVDYERAQRRAAHECHQRVRRAATGPPLRSQGPSVASRRPTAALDRGAFAPVEPGTRSSPDLSRSCTS